MLGVPTIADRIAAERRRARIWSRWWNLVSDQDS